MNTLVKRAAVIVGVLIALVVLFVVGFFAVLMITEYRPEEIEEAELQYHAEALEQVDALGALALPRPSLGVPFGVLTWNIGYAGLDETQDFFMDGGKNVQPESKELILRNLGAIRELITDADCEVILLQEADLASRRSYYTDQREYLAEFFNGSSAFAWNFRCVLVPVPFAFNLHPEVIGKVSSGLLTLNRFGTTEAFRIRLPSPFSWPARLANLKRCLLVSRVPLNDDGAELVIVNLHLEAYDLTGGREAQTRALLDFLYQEYENGNYCIAGGDFNQSFPNIDPVRYAVKNSEYFIPGVLDPDGLDEGWRYVTDASTPTSRLVNEPYNPDSEATQLYVIDGFLLSPNVELLAVKTLDLGFKNSDHHPVKIEVVLQ